MGKEVESQPGSVPASGRLTPASGKVKVSGAGTRSTESKDGNISFAPEFGWRALV